MLLPGPGPGKTAYSINRSAVGNHRDPPQHARLARIVAPSAVPDVYVGFLDDVIGEFGGTDDLQGNRSGHAGRTAVQLGERSLAAARGIDHQSREVGVGGSSIRRRRGSRRQQDRQHNGTLRVGGQGYPTPARQTNSARFAETEQEVTERHRIATCRGDSGTTGDTEGVNERAAQSLDLAEIAERADALSQRGRSILGLTGPPGAGKSTVAAQLAAALGPKRAVLVPMDGFHLANVTLIAAGSRERKGAWDTFDTEGYVHLLRRLRQQSGTVVFAPAFDRDLEESIGGAISVSPDVPLIITEGNYLLSARGGWAQVAELLDECWYLELDDTVRVDRLVKRREGHGSDHEEATHWALGSDQANADVVAESRDRADLVLCLRS